MRAATASLLALAILAIAPSSALADPARHHHDYYNVLSAGPARAATSSSSLPWTSIGVAIAAVALTTLVLTTRRLSRRTRRIAT